MTGSANAPMCKPDARGSLGNAGIPDIAITVSFLVDGRRYVLFSLSFQRAPDRATVGRRVNLGARL
jgi:hypothetical protein